MNTRKRVLIIDDDPGRMDRIVAILGDEFEVLTHHGPFGSAQAVRSLQPDLVLVELNMRELSGETICSILRSSPETKCIPILLRAACDDTFGKRVARFCGATAYMQEGTEGVTDFESLVVSASRPRVEDETTSSGLSAQQPIIGERR